VLGTYSRKSWLPGFKIGAGLSYTLLEDLNAFTEIEYSYFRNSPKGGESPLALNKARYTGLLALNTKIYFSF
jgi:opacity protein-like surface antigen